MLMLSAGTTLIRSHVSTTCGSQCAQRLAGRSCSNNLAIKWKAFCGDDAACRHSEDTEKPGTELAAQLSDAAGQLYEKLAKEYYWDGRKRRKIWPRPL